MDVCCCLLAHQGLAVVCGLLGVMPDTNLTTVYSGVSTLFSACFLMWNWVGEPVKDTCQKQACTCEASIHGSIQQSQKSSAFVRSQQFLLLITTTATSPAQPPPLLLDRSQQHVEHAQQPPL
jgi:hypothetical protein